MSEGQSIRLQMARADEQDFKIVSDFMHFIEYFVEDGVDFNAEEDDEGQTPQLTNEEFVDRVRSAFSRWSRGPNVGSCWGRVVHGGQVAIENCCDANSDVLAWRRDVAELIEARKQLLEHAAEYYRRGAMPGVFLHPARHFRGNGAA